jgi:hypothetical protein
MKCSLCEKEIVNYNSQFNHLDIDEKHSFEICLGCTNKIGKWQGKVIASLFPTKALKKRFGK